MRLIARLLLPLVGGALLLSPALAQTPPAAPPTPTPPVILQPEPPATPDRTMPETPQSPPKPKRRLRIGPEVGVFLPSDSKTQDRFGSSWLSLGVGFDPIRPVNVPSRFEFDFSLVFRNHDGNHIFLAPIGARFVQALTNDPRRRAAVPYAGVAADFYLADIKSDQDNVRSGLRTAVGGSALLGLNFGDRSRIEARYQVLSRIKGFDFSGLTLSAGYRF